MIKSKIFEKNIFEEWSSGDGAGRQAGNWMKNFFFKFLKKIQ